MFSTDEGKKPMFINDSSTTGLEKARSEWISSCIDETLIDLNLRYISEDAVYEALLSFKECDRRNDGRLRDSDLRLYEDPARGGWVCHTVDVRTGEVTEFCQFKPDFPRIDPKDPKKEKRVKYETPIEAKAQSFVLAPQISLEVWQKISDRYDVPIPEIPENAEITPLFYEWLCNHPSIPLLLTEGFKKVCCLLSQGYAAIGLTGHSMGTINDEEEKRRYLNPQLGILCERREKVIFCLDQDEKPQTRKEVQYSIGKMAGCIFDVNPTGVMVHASWKPEHGKGVDDLISLNGLSSFETAVKKAKPVAKVDPTHGFKSKSDDDSKPFDPRDHGLPNFFHSEIAKHIAKKYRDVLAWNVDIGEFYRYSAKKQGIWSIDRGEFVNSLISKEIDWILARYQEILENKGKSSQKFRGYSNSFVLGVREMLKSYMAVEDFKVNNDLIPFENGVLNLKTKEFLSHSPEFKLTWSLPYDYDKSAKCEPILKFLKDQIGDSHSIAVVRSFLHGILTSRVDWQKFLELCGSGGSGKGTLLRLSEALIGRENVHTTTLKKLEESRFETASIKDKKLVLITDSDQYTGGCSTLKAITGQDTLPFEKKGKQSTSGFVSSALVLIATNEPIKMNDHTSGLTRRRITVSMNNSIDENKMRNLIEIKNNSIEGEFAPFMSGFVNWVLDLDPVEATATIKDHSRLSNSLRRSHIESILSSNPMSEWADRCLVERLDTVTYCGSISKSSDLYLYPSYFNFCKENGYNPVAINRFTVLLNDLLSKQMKIKVDKGRDRDGSFFKHIAVRGEYDQDLLLFSKDLFDCDDGDGKNDFVTVAVTAQTLTSDKCDGSEGIFINSNSEETENNDIFDYPPQKKNDDDLEKTQSVRSEDIPSQPSQSSPVRVSAITEPSQIPSQPSQAITDNVMEWDSIIAKQDELMRQIGWTQDDGKQYIEQKYGQKTRRKLLDPQMIEFLMYLENYPKEDEVRNAV